MPCDTVPHDRRVVNRELPKQPSRTSSVTRNICPDIPPGVPSEPSERMRRTCAIAGGVVPHIVVSVEGEPCEHPRVAATQVRDSARFVAAALGPPQQLHRRPCRRRMAAGGAWALRHASAGGLEIPTDRRRGAAQSTCDLLGGLAPVGASASQHRCPEVSTRHTAEYVQALDHSSRIRARVDRCGRVKYARIEIHRPHLGHSDACECVQHSRTSDPEPDSGGRRSRRSRRSNGQRGGLTRVC